MSQQGVTVEFDDRKQLERIQAMIVPGETLYAVFDLKGAGTGYLGISDLRLIFMDKAFLRKQKSLVTLPFSKVTVIASEDTGGVLGFGSSKLTIMAGSQEWEFEFRSNDKAHRAYSLILWNILQHEKRGMMIPPGR